MALILIISAMNEHIFAEERVCELNYVFVMYI